MKYGEESSNIRLLYINNFIKKYDHRVLPYQLCEICFKSKNLIICSICKSFFHLKVNYYFNKVFKFNRIAIEIHL